MIHLIDLWTWQFLKLAMSYEEIIEINKAAAEGIRKRRMNGGIQVLA